MGDLVKVEALRSGQEATDDEIFKRMVINDKKQNQFLKNKLTKGSSGSYGVNKSKNDNKGEKSSRMRFVVVTLGVMSLAMSQLSRGVINYCITSMVDPRMHRKVSDSLPVTTSIPKLPITVTTMNGGFNENTTTIRPEARSWDGQGETTTSGPFTRSWDEQGETTTSGPFTRSWDERSETTTSGPYMRSWDERSETTTSGPYTTSWDKQGETTTSGPYTRSWDEQGETTTSGPYTRSWDEQGETETTTVNMNVTTTTDATSTMEIITTDPSIAETTTYQETTTIDLDAPVEDKFMWTIKEQSLVKGGFFYSYFFFMILGGRMSEIYGAKYVLLLGVAGSAIINLATPWMARNSLVMLIISRIIMGAIQSGVFPAMYALINKWLTMSEASIYAPMIKMSLRLGQLLSSLVPGLIHDWPSSFYVVGGLATVWSILWMIISTSEPATNRWVTKTELAHIMKKKKRTRDLDEEEAAIDMKVINPTESLEKSNSSPANGIKSEHTNNVRAPEAVAKKTPWIKIITSPSVIGLILVKLSFNFCSDFLAVELPSYLAYVHDASKQRISAITTAMFAIQVSIIIFAGWLAKVMIKKRPFNISKTGVRKLFQSVANLGGGMFLFMITIGNCDLIEATILLQLISLASVFTAGGETMIPYDLSDEYPATIMAIANSVANLSGVTVTTLTGFILGDQGGSQSRWNTVIGLIAGADMLGGLAFLFLVKAEPINFESKSKLRDIESKEVEMVISSSQGGPKSDDSMEPMQKVTTTTTAVTSDEDHEKSS